MQAVENGLLYLAENAIQCYFKTSDHTRQIFYSAEINEPILHFFCSEKRIYLSTATAFYCFTRQATQ